MRCTMSESRRAPRKPRIAASLQSHGRRARPPQRALSPVQPQVTLIFGAAPPPKQAGSKREADITFAGRNQEWCLGARGVIGTDLLVLQHHLRGAGVAIAHDFQKGVA